MWTPRWWPIGTLCFVSLPYCSTVAQEPPFTWSPPAVSVHLQPGTLDTILVTFTSVESFPKVALRPSATLANFLVPSILDDINPGTTVDTTLAFVASSLEMEGEHAGSVQVVLPFLRGDSNDDGVLDISDAVRTLLGLFAGVPLRCIAAAVRDVDVVVGAIELQGKTAGRPWNARLESFKGVDHVEVVLDLGDVKK